MKSIHIAIHKGFFTVVVKGNKAGHAVETYYNKFTTFKSSYDFRRRKYVREPGHVYAGKVLRNDEYRFASAYLKDFVHFMRIRGISTDDISHEVAAYPLPVPISLSIKDTFVAREYQEKYVDALCNCDGRYQSLVDLQTGKGKSLIALFALKALNERAIFIMKPKYISKWVSDLKEKLNTEKGDIVVVKGAIQLDNLVTSVRDYDEPFKIVIISSRTLHIYIKKYELAKRRSDFEYLVEPTELLETLSVRKIFVDEIHQEFHSIFKTLLYLDAEQLIALSATFETDNASVRTYHNALFPKESRLDFLEYDRYVTVFAIEYDVEFAKFIRCVTSRGYSHVEFEKYLLRKPRQLANYLKMIDYYLDEGYLKLRSEGDTALVFAATTKMCTIIADYLRKQHRNLNVTRYVEDDPFEKLEEGDVVCSTVLSAGTAMDKSGLISVFQTISIKSSVANNQTLGRLRKMGDRELRYYYFFTKGIPKQAEYHTVKMDLFAKKAKRIFIRNYMNTI